MNATYKRLGMLIVIIATVAALCLIAYVRFSQRNPGYAQAPSIEEELKHIGVDTDLGTQLFSMRLSSTLESDVFHFDGNCIQVNMACRREGDKEASSDYFSVELHRIDAGLIDTLVGSATFTRWGPSSFTFERVGAGDYYLRFIKDNDGQIVVSDTVRVYAFMLYDE